MGPLGSVFVNSGELWRHRSVGLEWGPGNARAYAEFAERGDESEMIVNDGRLLIMLRAAAGAVFVGVRR